MPYVKPTVIAPLDDDMLAVREALKDAKPGEFVKIDPEVMRRISERAHAAAMPAIIEARRNERRLAWLHSPQSNDVDGYEWGIFRVKWQDGRPVEVWQTLNDFSDLDAAMTSPSGVSTDPSKEPK